MTDHDRTFLCPILCDDPAHQDPPTEREHEAEPEAGPAASSAAPSDARSEEEHGR